MHKFLKFIFIYMMLFSAQGIAADMPAGLGDIMNAVKGIAEQSMKQNNSSQLDQAKQDAAIAQQEAERAKQEAAIAQQEAERAKQEAAIAQQEAERAKQEAAATKQQAEREKQLADSIAKLNANNNSSLQDNAVEQVPESPPLPEIAEVSSDPIALEPLPASEPLPEIAEVSSDPIASEPLPEIAPVDESMSESAGSLFDGAGDFLSLTPEKNNAILKNITVILWAIVILGIFSAPFTALAHRKEKIDIFTDRTDLLVTVLTGFWLISFTFIFGSDESGASRIDSFGIMNWVIYLTSWLSILFLLSYRAFTQNGAVYFIPVLATKLASSLIVASLYIFAIANRVSPNSTARTVGKNPNDSWREHNAKQASADRSHAKSKAESAAMIGFATACVLGLSKYMVRNSEFVSPVKWIKDCFNKETTPVEAVVI